MIPRPTLRTLAALAALTAASVASAQSVVFTNFNTATTGPSGDLTLNGNAQIVTPSYSADKVLRLTPSNYYQAGSAFSTTAITLNNNSFSTAFSFRITEPFGGGADGLVFVMQTVGNNVGGAGGGIGYLGISNSLGIEFDTWYNGPGLGDWSDNHIAINTGGAFTTDTSRIADLPVPSQQLDNGNLWYAWVDYNDTTDNLEVRFSGANSRPLTALLSTTIDLPTVLGSNTAYVGFTSGTGAAGGNHDIVSWQFNNNYRPIDNPDVPQNVPDAGATAGLLTLGLAGLAALRRRRN